MRELRWFREHEFRCRCGKCGKGIADMDDVLLAKLDSLREKVKRPLIISSAIRCEAHNASLSNSSRTSPHMRGLAVDLECRSNDLRFLILKNAFELGFRRIEIGSAWVHLDIDNEKTQDIVFLDKSVG